MKQLITHDTAKATAIARQIGAWPIISSAIAAGQQGMLTAGDWIFAFDADGALLAVQASEPIEQGLLTVVMAAQFEGPLRAEFPMPSWPTSH